ncbi:MAG TPA: hypothetical protein VHY09_08240 [Candidatus Methylacidiphilales bacterium]|jgi:hypothetical protein|nr:hypothetical protein [Candidatus Methylacidiphilales bacterium]
MYQLTNYGGSGLQVVTPDPPDAGGAAINANFKALATQIATGNPGIDDDSTAGFGVGSRWYNSTTTVEWICLSAAPGDAEWAAVASGALAGYLPLTGGTLTGTLAMGANAIDLDGASSIGADGSGDVAIAANALSVLANLNMNSHAVTGVTTLNSGVKLLGTSSAYAGATAQLQFSARNNGVLSAYINNTVGSDNYSASLGLFPYKPSDGTFPEAFRAEWNMNQSYVPLNMNGKVLNLNTGGGAGGTTLNMDGGLINFNPDATTPTNTTTPAGWIKIQINGSAAWLPYYQ